MTEAGETHVRGEIQRRLSDGSLLLSDGEGVVVSPLGAVPKGVSEHRTIHHLTFPRHGAPSVNSGISPEFCAMRYGTLAALFRQIAAARRMGRTLTIWKIDLADAYRHCVVALRDALLLGCFLDGRTALDTRLPFGCRSSPKLFNLYSEALHWILEARGIELEHYLDDFFGATDGDGRAVTELVCAIARSLGFRIREKKVEWGAVVVVLGVEVDALRGVATISAPRREMVLGLLNNLLDRGSASAIELMSIAGHLQFLVRVCPPGRAFIRRIYDAAAAVLHKAGPWRIPHSAKLDLRWWRDVLLWWDGVLIFREDREAVEIWSDASTSKGLGGHLGSRETPLDWWQAWIPDRLAGADIMVLEALALLESMGGWREAIRGRRLVCYVDNTVLYHSLRSGSCANRSVQSVIRAIYTILLEVDCELQPQWIPSDDNYLADALSRFANLSDLLPPSSAASWSNPADISVPDMPDSHDDLYPSPPSSPTLGPTFGY